MDDTELVPEVQVQTIEIENDPETLKKYDLDWEVLLHLVLDGIDWITGE